jgi:hypothetical protein
VANLEQVERRPRPDFDAVRDAMRERDEGIEPEENARREPDKDAPDDDEDEDED